MKESDWRKGILASDSTGVETDRYDYEVRSVKSKRKFEKILVKQRIEYDVDDRASTWSKGDIDKIINTMTKENATKMILQFLPDPVGDKFAELLGITP